MAESSAFYSQNKSHGQASVLRRIGKVAGQDRQSNHYATPPTVLVVAVAVVVVAAAG